MCWLELAILLEKSLILTMSSFGITSQLVGASARCLVILVNVNQEERNINNKLCMCYACIQIHMYIIWTCIFHIYKTELVPSPFLTGHWETLLWRKQGFWKKIHVPYDYSNHFSVSVHIKSTYCIPCEYVLSCFSHVQLFVTLWTIAYQVLLSLWFYWQEYWSGLPCPPPRIFLTQGPKVCLLRPSPALAIRFFTTSASWEAYCIP